MHALLDNFLVAAGSQHYLLYTPTWHYHVHDAYQSVADDNYFLHHRNWNAVGDVRIAAVAWEVFHTPHIAVGVAFQLRAVGGDHGRHNMVEPGRGENCHGVYRIAVAVACPFGPGVVRVGNMSQRYHVAMVPRCCRNVVAVLREGTN